MDHLGGDACTWIQASPISLSQLATGSASCGACRAYPPPGRTIMCVLAAEVSMINARQEGP